MAIRGSPTIVSTAAKSGFCCLKPTVLKASVKPSAVPSPETEPAALASMLEELTAETLTPPPLLVTVLSLMKARAPFCTLFETSTPLAAAPPSASTSLSSAAVIEAVESALTATSPLAFSVVLTIFASAFPETSLRAKMPPRPVADILPVGAAPPVVVSETTLVASSFFQRAKSAKFRFASVVLPRSTAAAKSVPMYWYTAPFSPRVAAPAQVSLRRIFSPNLTCRVPEAVV
ncbi:hypothetical protein HPGCJGGD_2571 [Methylobacterium haplocladii]|nr:hypothetical protein HPGCJGGD_2571 [Methylobacterium haplocladii]